MSALISVIIPSYNRPDLVRRAIASVLAQTYMNFEIIVVYDCSKIPVGQALRDITDPRLTIIRHEQNEGQSNARNTGIRHARGEWVAFLDDDDLWLPEKLEHQLNYIKQHAPIADACVTDYFDTETRTHHKVSVSVRKKGCNLILLHWEGLAPSTWMVQRLTFEKIGFFDPLAPRAEDWEWFVRFCLSRCVLAVVPEELTFYSGIHNANRATEVDTITKIGSRYRAVVEQKFQPGYVHFLDIYVLRMQACLAFQHNSTLHFLLLLVRIATHLFAATCLMPKIGYVFVREQVLKKLGKSECYVR